MEAVMEVLAKTIAISFNTTSPSPGRFRILGYRLQVVQIQGFWMLALHRNVKLLINQQCNTSRVCETTSR